MRAILLATAALAFASAAAVAQPALIAEPARPGYPVPVTFDLNVRKVEYTQDVRYRVLTNPERLLVMHFPPNEQVSRIVFGDAVKAGTRAKQILDKADNAQQSGNTQGEALGSILHLWAQNEGFTTVLVVTVVDEGAKPERPYMFAVRVQKMPDPCAPSQPEIGCCANVKECDDPEATYVLHIINTEQKKQEEAARRREEADRQRGLTAAREEERQRQREAGRHTAGVSRLSTSHYAGGPLRNTCWKGQGHREIGPAKDPSDNAQELVLDFDGRAIPAILHVKPDNTDGGPIQHTMRNGLVVLQEVPSKVRMRVGRTQVLDLIRCAPAPHVDPGTGTVDPGVVRQVRRVSR